MTSVIDQAPIQLLPQPFSAGALAPGATAFSVGYFNVSGYLNGRLRGNAHSNQVGTLLIEFSNDGVNTDLAFVATQDAVQPDVQYPFDVIVLQSFVRVSFVNGGVASTFFRANSAVLSI